MPNSLSGKAYNLKENTEYLIHVVSDKKGQLFFNPPNYGKLKIRSNVAELIDYYFVAESTVDGAVSGYRNITGAAPLYGKWVYGFW